MSLKPGSRWVLKAQPSIPLTVLFVDEVSVLYAYSDNGYRALVPLEAFLQFFEPAPEPPTKHQVYINLYADGISGAGYKTEEEAKAHANSASEVIETRCIEWEVP